LDASSVYFLARLSPHYPTIEVRVADTCLDVEDTVLFAGVVRALVALITDILITDIRQHVKLLPVPGTVIMTRLLDAALGRVEPAGLLARITPELDRAGDTGEVYAGFERLRREGHGADRQRRLWHAHGAAKAYVGALADATTPLGALH
jgi:carboxylate-amine ligase